MAEEKFERGGYLGVDESIIMDKTNRHKIGYIMTGVRSFDENDIVKKYLEFPKRRILTGILEAAEGRDFRYLKINPRQIDATKINPYGLSVLLSYFNPEKVIMDGEISTHGFFELERIMYPKKLPEIIFSAKADESYKLVNIADRLSYLFRDYHMRSVKSSNNRNPYKKFLLVPNEDDYEHLLRKTSLKEMDVFLCRLLVMFEKDAFRCVNMLYGKTHRLDKSFPETPKLDSNLRGKLFKTKLYPTDAHTLAGRYENVAKHIKLFANYLQELYEKRQPYKHSIHIKNNNFGKNENGHQLPVLNHLRRMR